MRTAQRDQASVQREDRRRIPRQRRDVARDRAQVDPQFGDHFTRTNREAVTASGIPKNTINATMSRSNV